MSGPKQSCVFLLCRFSCKRKFGLANILFVVWNDVNRDFYLMFVVAV